MKCTLSKFDNDTRLGGAVEPFDSREALEGDLIDKRTVQSPTIGNLS